MSGNHHVEDALYYCQDVLDGRIPACKWTKAACQRQLDDLDRQKSDDGFPYVFNGDKASEVIDFIERMPHVKGEWASRGEKLALHPSQKFRISTIFGWVHVETGNRRFIQVYIEEARKNGKSAETAAVANFMMTADKEEGAEIWSAATTRDQAAIVFKLSRAMARKASGYARHYGVAVHMRAMSVDHTNSTYQALSADAHTLDGLNPHFASLDEVHAAKTRSVYDVLESALGSRAQPLLWLITTAGFDRSGICYEIRTYLTRILNTTLHKHDGLGYEVAGSSAVDDTFFGIIYTIDDDDDYMDEACWIKANPLLDVSVKSEDIARMCKKASEMPSALNNFLTKRLNIWVNAATAWMDMRAWDSCAEPLDIEDFEGEECIIGIDLASRKDIAAVVRVFRREIEGEDHYYVKPRFYLPEETIDTSPNSQYSGWVRSGDLLVTAGNTIDFDEIEDDFLDDDEYFDIIETGVDPHQATQFMTRMMKKGVDITEVRPLVLNFSEPMKEVEALVLQGRLHHDGNPCMSWCVANTEAAPDKKDNIYPRKSTDANKIDGLVALLMAINLWMRHSGRTESVYESRGIRAL